MQQINARNTINKYNKKVYLFLQYRRKCRNYFHTHTNKHGQKTGSNHKAKNGET